MAAALLLTPLFLLGGVQASHFYGTVMTFTPKETWENGSIMVVFRYKLSFRSCTDEDSWNCISGDCGSEKVELENVDEETGEWCQREGVMTRQVFTDAPFQLRLDGGNWLDDIQNGVSSWRAVTQVDLRTRSDTGKPNRSPQTTILPALRVPSNCQRDFRLLAFDPDADRVKCRFGKTAADECSPCSPPSVLTISPSCTLSFSPTGSETEGPYAVQIEMEDFPNQSLSLIQDDGVKTTRSPTDALSKIPVRFALIVDPAAPSCSEGLYLPRFLPPTPAYGAQLIAFINETLEVTIVAEAKESQISRLVLSGPHGVKSRPEGSNGQFILALTPSEEQNGETHPVCFVVQSMHNSFRYHSELHCVIVTIDTRPITTVPPSTSTSVPTTNQETTSTFPSTSVNQRKDGDKTRTLDEASVTETLA